MINQRKMGASEEFKVRIMNKKNIHAQNDFRGNLKIIYVIQGTVKVVTRYDGYKLYTDDLLVINNGTKFSYDKISENIIIAEFDIPQVLFRNENSGFIGYIWCNSLAEPQKDYSGLKETMKKLLRRYLLSQKKGYYFTAGFYQIVQILEDSFLMSSEQVKGKIPENEQRVSQIVTYIESNFNQEISLNDLSEILNLSVPYLSKFISNNFGMTFSSYVRILRLKYTANQLMNTEYSVTRIAMDSGFSNMQTFNKAFSRQYGVTPSEFRKKMAHLELEGRKSHENELLNKVEKILRREDKVQENKIIYQFDTKRLEPVEIKKEWNNIISVGPISELKNASVRDALLAYRKKIPVKYVRFWNIQTSEMNLEKYISENDIDYDYEYIDECIDFLINNNFVPYWHLAFIPKEFNVNQNIVEELHIKYKSLDEIGGTFRALIKHLLHRYGKSVLNNWVFDLWYPQSYFVSLPEFLRAGDGFDYLSMLYEILKQYLPDTRIGVANFSMVYGEERIKKEINCLIARKIFPDFISCIVYPYEFRNNKRRWILFEEFIYKQMATYRKIIDMTIWKGLPFYIVEFGLSAFQRNLLNDTRFRGAYIISNVLQILGSVEMVGTYILKDSYLSAIDTNQLLFGGSGLIAKNGILKPAFFAMLFLSKIEKYCIKKTKNYILSTDMRDDYVLICHNMGNVPLELLYGSEQAITRDIICNDFYEGMAKEIVFEMEGANPGKYKITENKVDSEHGDIMNWISRNYTEAGLSVDEQTDLLSVTLPKIRIFSVEVGKDEIMSFSCRLNVNDFVIYRITKIKDDVSQMK